MHALDNVGVEVPGALPDRRPAAGPADARPAGRPGRCRGVVREVRPDVVHAHNWIINSYLPLAAARRLPLVYSLHDYSHVCPNKRLMYDDELRAPAPAPQEVLQLHHRLVRRRARARSSRSLVRSGRPCATGSSTCSRRSAGSSAQANQLDEQGVRVAGGAQLRARLAPVRRATCLGTRSCPRATTSSSPATCPSRRASGTAPGGLRHRSTRPPGRHSCSSAAPRWTCPRCPRVRSSTRSGSTRGCCPASGTRWPPCCRAEWPDPCPTTVLEAMALGAPLVTTHMGGIADMVVDGESALVVPPGDVAGHWPRP